MSRSSGSDGNVPGHRKGSGIRMRCWGEDWLRRLSWLWWSQRRRRGWMKYLKRWFGMVNLYWFVVHNFFFTNVSYFLVTFFLVGFFFHRLVAVFTSFKTVQLRNYRNVSQLTKLVQPFVVSWRAFLLRNLRFGWPTLLINLVNWPCNTSLIKDRKLDTRVLHVSLMSGRVLVTVMLLQTVSTNVSHSGCILV